MHRTTASRRLRHFLTASEAVSALEYAILVGIITVGIGAAVAVFSQDVQQVIADIGDSVQTRDELVEDSTAPAP